MLSAHQMPVAYLQPSIQSISPASNLRIAVHWGFIVPPRKSKSTDNHQSKLVLANVELNISSEE